MARATTKRWIPEIEVLEDRLAPATYTVDTPADNLAPAGGGEYTAASCSLRWALTDMATNLDETETINIGNIAGGQIALTQGLPTINNSGVTINGPATGVVSVVRAAGLGGALAFSNFSVGRVGEATITRLTIANGSAQYGGAINCSGELTLIDDKFSNNAAVRGGAIYLTNLPRPATISGCTIQNNLADRGGGIALVAEGQMILDNTTVVSNQARIAGGGLWLSRTSNPATVLTLMNGTTIEDNEVLAPMPGTGTEDDTKIGGGIYNERGDVIVRAGMVSILDNKAGIGGGIYNRAGNFESLAGSIVRIDGNQARLNGGGIRNNEGQVNLSRAWITFNFANGAAPDGIAAGILNSGEPNIAATVTITDGTIARNQSREGTAVRNFGNAATTTLRGVAVVLNTATSTDSSAVAGGIENGGGGTVILVNTIVALNTDEQGSPDVFGVFDDLGHNLVGITDGSTGLNLSTLLGTALIPLDPNLNPLGWYGGPLQTMTLKNDSPALDAGDNSYASSVDQRGFTRIVNGTVDIGPVEMQTGETSQSGPFAFPVAFSVAYKGALNADDGDYTLLDYSGNDPDDVTIVEVNGDDANVGVATATTHGGSVTLNADGTFVYTAPDDYVGDDSFTYTIQLGEDTATGTVTLHVTDIVANDVDFSTLIDHALTISAGSGLLLNAYAPSGEDLYVSEVNGDDGNINSATATDHGSVTVQADGSFVYTPDSAFAGDDTFEVSFSDGISTATATVTVHVVNVLATDGEYTTVHNAELTVVEGSGLITHASDADDDDLTVTAIDGDPDAIDAEVITANGGALTVQADGSFVYTAAAGFAGDDWFSYTVSDGDDHTSTAFVVIHVTNNAPTAYDLAATIIHDHTLTIPGFPYASLIDYSSDADGDDLTVVAVNGDYAAIGSEVATTHGHVTMQADGSFGYVPNTGFAGSDSFTYTVSDGITTTTGTVTIGVTETPPSAIDLEYTTNQNVTLSVPGYPYASLISYSSDYDGDAITVCKINGIALVSGTITIGSLTVNDDGSFVYIPAANSAYDDVFTFTITDGLEETTATLTIHVV